MEKVAAEVAKTVQDLFGEAIEVKLTIPEDSAHGDFSTNAALQLAGKLRRNPREIATQIAEKLPFEAEVAGPGFINVHLTGVQLSQMLDAAWSETYGENTDGAGKTVLVEYPSANVAKPYSVGHLRSGNQGWAARNLMLATGWKVITDNHLGDYGTPFGVWARGFNLLSNEDALARDGVNELGRVYIEMRAQLKEEAEAGGHDLADQVQDWLKRLEAGDTEAVALSQRFTDISLRHIHDVMDRLGISTDYELGEKFYAERGKALVQEYLTNGIFEQNADGSVICGLDDFGIDVPLLVQKSNGAALYATTDLATIIYREAEFAPNKVIYSVGAEQKFYFEQLFAMAAKLGVTTELVHLWFGTIDQVDDSGKRAKMSSRKGVVLMEDLLDQAEEEARGVVAGREVSEDDIKKIAVGAIKFNDFTKDRRTGILFDWQTIFALNGFSGPYVQYALVRINKILRDNRDFELVDFAGYDFAAEKPLIKALLDYPDVVRRSANLLEPHRLAFFLHTLAKLLNQYYEQNPVSSADPATRSARLGVLRKVSSVAEHALNILGIDVPNRM